MKKVISLILCLVFLCSICSPALAGETEVEDNGKIYVVSYSITLNGNTATGSVSATTGCDRSAKLGVRAVIWFTGENGTGSDAADNIKSNTTRVIANISVPGGNYAYKGTSGHTFTRSDGSVWSKGLSKNF